MSIIDDTRTQGDDYLLALLLSLNDERYKVRAIRHYYKGFLRKQVEEHIAWHAHLTLTQKLEVVELLNSFYTEHVDIVKIGHKNTLYTALPKRDSFYVHYKNREYKKIYR